MRLTQCFSLDSLHFIHVLVGKKYQGQTAWVARVQECIAQYPFLKFSEAVVEKVLDFLNCLLAGINILIF